MFAVGYIYFFSKAIIGTANDLWLGDIGEGASIVKVTGGNEGILRV